MIRFSSLRARLVGTVFIAIAPAWVLMYYNNLPWPGFVVGLLALVAAWLDKVPTGWPNATCRLQVTAELSETATTTLTDCPGSTEGLLDGLTNCTGARFVVLGLDPPQPAIPTHNRTLNAIWSCLNRFDT